MNVILKLIMNYDFMIFNCQIYLKKNKILEILTKGYYEQKCLNILEINIISV